MALQSPWEVADQAAGALAPESGLVGDTDVAELGRAMALAVGRAISNPAAGLDAVARLSGRLAPIPAVALSRWMGGRPTAPVDLNPKDRRFLDPAWTDNPLFYGLRLAHAAWGTFTDDLVEV